MTEFERAAHAHWKAGRNSAEIARRLTIAGHCDPAVLLPDECVAESAVCRALHVVRERQREARVA